MRALFLGLLAVFFVAGCGDDKEKKPLEINGSYQDPYGGTHVISDDLWDQGAMGKYHIVAYDNEKDYLFAQNDERNAYNPGKWSRFDWVWHNGALYYCQSAYDKASQKEAEAVEAADPTNPEQGGCGGFPWTKLTKVTFAGAVGTPDCPAISKDDPRIVAWASAVASYAPGENVSAQWQDTAKALGPAEGKTTEVVSLGEGGSITLTFEHPISDGEGPDFVVFENSFSDTFLELAFVEVSSDGKNFVRFDTVYLGNEVVSEYGTLDPTLLDGFAGKYRAGWGTPFDLAVLAGKSAVKDGTLDLAAVTHVRLVDVKGDGSLTDSTGRPVYDPYPTHESAGFDLEAVGILY